MMRLASSLVAGAVFLSASTNIVAAELRGTVSSSPSSSSEDDKPTIGLYANGGDPTTIKLISDALPPLFNKDCAIQFNWEVTHYGMTEEKDGKFYTKEEYGGAANVEYLKAINCLQSMVPMNKTNSMMLAQSLMMFDVIGSTWEGLQQWIDKDTTRTIQQCMDEKANSLLHAAGVKTAKDVKFDVSKTKDLAITYNGKQEMNWLTEKVKDTWCKWSNHNDACCAFTPGGEDTLTHISITTNERKETLKKTLQYLSQTIKDQKKIQ